MIISDVAIRNRTTVFSLMVLIVIAGVISYITLPREASPDVPVPLVLVTTTYEGVSPEDVESSVTMKIEKELAGLKGLKEIRSTSAEGLSMIVIEFQPDIRVEDALQHVRDKVDLARGELPTGADEPVIKEINIAEFPIMMVNISGSISPVRLKAIADELEDAIEAVPGVLNVDVLGGLEREIRVEIDPDRVAAYGLTIPELLELIPSENVNISAGGLETPGTRFNVRVPAEFIDAGEVDHLPLAVRNGRTIYLADVAKVCDTFKDRQSYSRLDGIESITLSIQKRTGANILAVAEGVGRVLEQARRRAPAGVQFQVTLDQSADTHMLVSDLENNVVSGFILVALVLLLFMGWRTSAIVALAIPMSLLMSFAFIKALGYTLNMVVLFSLILAVGMLVDNAIVIVENIFRHRQLGKDRITAAMTGTGEVAWPVITSTATTVAAFAPMAFWPGIMGEFMKYLPITVIITLGSSLFVAMVISPTICSVAAGGAGRPRRENFFVRGYRRLLGASLRHWPVTITLAVLLLAGLGAVYVKRGNGIELLPDFDPRRAYINIRSPQGTNLRESDRLARIVERRVEPFRKDLKHVITNVGSAGEGFSLVGSASGPHVANVTLLFLDYQDRPPERPSAKVVEEIRRALADIPGAEIKVEKEKEGPPTGAPVTVRISGKDFRELQRLSEQAKRLISDPPVPGLVNLRSDLEAARPELVFKVDRRRAMLLGVNTRIIGNFLKMAVFGTEVSTFREFNDEHDITIRLPLSQRQRIEDLFRLRVPNLRGQAVPLSSLGEFDYHPGFGTIHRINQKRVVTLTADAEGRRSEEVLRDVQARLDALGDNRLRTGDIRDWPAFCRALLVGGSTPEALPARRIWRLLRPRWLDRNDLARARAAIEKVAREGRARQEDKKAILAAINRRVIANRRFYDRADFAHVRLPDEARQLLARGAGDLDERELRRLNRLLLRASFPDLIAPVRRLVLPPGYTITYAGEKEEQQKAMTFLKKAFVFALLLIVVILVAQFNTLSVPLIIMSTVILSLIGVLAGLLICHMPFGIIMTGVGVISLAGVVVNNAIVLLDYTRQLQRRGLDVVAAATEAGVTRLRPVLLTATTTILGLIPMAIGVSLEIHDVDLANFWGTIINTRSESSQWWSSMAIAVIFGLAFATLLTLVVVPTLYTVLYRAAARFGLGGLRRPAAPQHAGPAGAPSVATPAGRAGS